MQACGGISLHHWAELFRSRCLSFKGMRPCCCRQVFHMMLSWSVNRQQLGFGSSSQNFPCCQGGSRHWLVPSYGNFYCGFSTEDWAIYDFLFNSCYKFEANKFFEACEALGVGCFLNTFPAHYCLAQDSSGSSPLLSHQLLCLLQRVCNEGA